MDSKAIIEKIKSQVKATKTTRWIRFGLVALLFFAWVAWMGNWWLSIFILLLFDIYITGFIPFDWWKESKNKVVRTVMSWVDAIVYALILVYFVFAFVGQNYQIPSSSLPIYHEREGEVPGTHIIAWDSEVDTITIEHKAKSREGFALGAVVAAEWVCGRKGFLTMDQLMHGLIKNSHLLDIK